MNDAAPSNAWETARITRDELRAEREAAYRARKARERARPCPWVI